MTAVVLAALALAGCGEATPVAARDRALGTAAGKREVAGSMTMMEIASAGRSWRVRVEDGPAARDFLAQLPFA